MLPLIVRAVVMVISPGVGPMDATTSPGLIPGPVIPKFAAPMAVIAAIVPASIPLIVVVPFELAKNLNCGCADGA
jgi:hypothetical protein